LQLIGIEIGIERMELTPTLVTFCPTA